MTTHVDVTIAAPPHVVWRALRNPELLRRWHGWEGEGLDEEVREIYLSDAVEDVDRQMLVVSGGDRFTLRPSDSGTTVRLTRAPRGSDPEQDAYYDDITQGWWTFLHQLRFGLECHGLAERRTVFLEGELGGAAGLLESLPAEAGGEVLARSPSQVAVVLPGPEKSLLVLARQPVTESRPRGGFLLLLTTYGLDDDAFAALERRWTSWWESRGVRRG